MRISRLTYCLLALLSTVAGCSQTGAIRTAPDSSVRTVASLGDKPLPIVAGEPGQSVRPETEEPDLLASTGSRISGRVYDERGRPVPNAKVRLAVGGSPGGKVNVAMTDRSGAFTLRGLRAGSTYTLIADYQGGEGDLHGRTEARAPKSNVRIALRARSAGVDQGQTSIRPARPRVEPISNVDTAEDEEQSRADADDKRINGEDLVPRPSETESPASVEGQREAAESPGGAPVPLRAGWNLRSRPTAADAGTRAGSREQAAETVTKPESSSYERPALEVDDEGPNPLPPALEPRQDVSARLGVPSDDSPLNIARNEERSQAPRTPSGSNTLDRRDTRRSRLADRSLEGVPRSIPDDLLPQTREITPESSAPILVTDPQSAEVGWPQLPKPSRRPSSSATSGAPVSDSPGTNDRSSLTDPPRGGDASPSSRRPTWGELSFNENNVPLDESLRRADFDAPTKDRQVVTLTSASQGAKPGRSRLLGGLRPASAVAGTEAVFSFDPMERRLVDLRLPGVDGRMVSLRDVDAELILLDFWGSWCKECRKSIPHHIELATKLGGKRLQVIAIACERGSSLHERLASAAKSARSLGINYPVLVSSMDGSCPVQNGLQIQFYPTMILLDREGRILGREHGATDITMARIDRTIAAVLRRQNDLAEVAPDQRGAKSE